MNIIAEYRQLETLLEHNKNDKQDLSAQLSRLSSNRESRMQTLQSYRLLLDATHVRDQLSIENLIERIEREDEAVTHMNGEIAQLEHRLSKMIAHIDLISSKMVELRRVLRQNEERQELENLLDVSIVRGP